MPSKRPQFGNGEFYHVFNRGVEKRDIFHEDLDYFKFISCLRRFSNDNKILIPQKEQLVKIIAFCLMPNHYHLILQQLVDGGTSLFMKKMGDSYVLYFNEKYNRKGMGSLFQGKFKAVHVEDNDQLKNLVCYVFSNPIEMIDKDWKNKEVKNIEEYIDFLKSYRWSSFLDCINIANFPSVADNEFVKDFFSDSAKIEKAVRDWIRGRTP